MGSYPLLEIGFSCLGVCFGFVFRFTEHVFFNIHKTLLPVRSHSDTGSCLIGHHIK